MTRKEAREWVIKYLYSRTFQDQCEESLEDFLEHQELDQNEIAYMRSVVAGVEGNLQSIDQDIEKYLRSWTTSRIPKLDLAILRAAVFEIKYSEDIPTGVAINEAVEIAKNIRQMIPIALSTVFWARLHARMRDGRHYGSPAN